MKAIKAVAIGILSLAGILQAQETGPIQTTTAPMSEPVIRQRMRILGYTNVQITRTNTLRYEIKATKEGKPVVMSFHPQTGAIEETAPGKPAKRWLMPVEPPATFRNEKMPSHH
jgi:hypothetical protein